MQGAVTSRGPSGEGVAQRLAGQLARLPRASAGVARLRTPAIAHSPPLAAAPPPPPTPANVSELTIRPEGAVIAPPAPGRRGEPIAPRPRPPPSPQHAPLPDRRGPGRPGGRPGAR